MAYRVERIAFRFLRLTEQTVACLREEQAGVKSRSSYNRPGYVTGVFPLKEEEHYDWIEPFIAKHGVLECDYDVFVSVSTDSDSAIVEGPGFALKLNRKVGGGITFSFTVLSED